ncbi:C-type lectin domain family 4 member F [Camelus dromedarius]|uniref:C-type lectin domain family 4 member F n=1 Tax=Camelus dromedarius TaxID=9838 RepID=A0A5N4D7F1_CAMDR|nr:C-type lectin domain family 4 member F [Camelus dromedarius]
MKGAESEVPDAHFTVDKQNVSLWPRGKNLRKACSELGAQPAVCWSFNKCSPFLSADPPPKTGRSLVLGRCLTVGAAVIFLTLVLLASVLLQAILYPWFLGTISDVKTNAQVLESRVDNISALSSEVKRNRGGVEAAGVQVQMVNASLDHMRSQIRRLETGVKEANARIQTLTSSWEAEFLYKMAGGLLYWIGLTKAGSEGDWYWVDDTPFNKVQSARFWIPGLDSAAVTPAASKMPRRLWATLAFVAVTLVSSLVALFVVDPYHLDRVAELQEAVQMCRGHVENSSAWSLEIQMLMCRVDNVSSQIQSLGGRLDNASADIQMVKGRLKDAHTWSFQTQMLRSSLEGTSSEIQKLKGDLEEAEAVNSQTQSFLKSSLGNTSMELRLLSRGLDDVDTEIQVLKAGLETANAQILLANSNLQNASAQIHVLRGHLDGIDDLRAQQQDFRRGLEGATSEMQRLKESLQNTNTVNSQTQTFIKGSLDNTSAEIQALRSHLERAGDELHLLRRDLETATAQTQRANGRLEQTDAQVQVLQTRLENATALKPNIQVLNGQLRDASREIETLKQGMRDAAALNSKTQMLESQLQKASAEIQKLKGDLKNTKTLTTKIQEIQSSLETLRAASASLEQQQRTRNQLLQLILQGWKSYNGNLYYFSLAEKSWHDAEQSCVSQGAHLASVTSEEEQAFLMQFTSTAYHWIGLTDWGTEGHWRWADDTPFNSARSSAFWDQNQPDNWRHRNGLTEDCVHVQKKWNDMYCSALYHWVCKKPMAGV